MATVKASIQKDHYTTSIVTQTHEFSADEPMSNGGHDKGLAPTELLAASLAACTCITLRMYADKKGLPMDKVEVTVDVEKDPAGNGTNIGRYLHFTGDLTDEQKARLMEIANKCPVHNILSNPVTINTELQ